MAFYKLPAVFKDVKPGSKLFLFLSFWVLFFVFFAILSTYLITKVFHLPLASVDLSAETIAQYKFVQFISSMGIFVLPPLVLAGLFTEHPLRFLQLNTRPALNTLVLTFMILFFSIPILNLTVDWNAGLSLPDSLQPLEELIRRMEDDAERLTRMFLRAETTAGLMINLVLVALIPAIGEELLFRGVFQNLLWRTTSNAHVAIWIAAFGFSLLHFQFYGFFPRMLLGALFGYMFYWSGSLWVPVFAHFINNASAVLISYFTGDSGLQEELDSVGTNEDTWYYALTSVVVLVVMLRLFYRETAKKKPAGENAAGE